MHNCAGHGTEEENGECLEEEKVKENEVKES
jgi:hypothetical protein